MTRKQSFIFVTSCFIALAFSSGAFAGNEHWSKQFPKPKQSTAMTGATGMTDGAGAPSIAMAKWHKGKLYMAGTWPIGIVPTNPSKRDPNYRVTFWSWHPTKGYEYYAYHHSAKGGPGPDGVINDFVFMPDGRIIAGGEFLSIGNPNGFSYHRIRSLAVYNPKEPTANRWQPLVKSVQHNGFGTIKSLAYDPKGNDLWIGGSFQGYRMAKMEEFCFGVSKFNFDTKQWNIMVPGLRGGTGALKVKVDSSTTPSTIYMAGRFSRTAGNGKDPKEGSSTARYTTGFCAYQEGKGWITFPENQDKAIGREGPLQRAADFMFFDSVNVQDFLVDGKDIWIVGSFSEGKTTDGKPLRGIAKWDAAKQMWIDPTGKGGVGREIFSIAKAADGKIYFAGAFGAASGVSKFYDGFKNGDEARMAMSYDPATKKWEQLGDGLGGIVMPECRLTVHGNDVFYYGMFKQIGQDKKNESYYIARWNSTIDFSKGEAPLPEGADAPYDITEPGADASPYGPGNEHWSRKFVDAPRQSGGKSKQSAATGMDDGLGGPTQINAMEWHDGILYFGGNWEVTPSNRWFVWTYDPANGWAPLGSTVKNKSTGWRSPPEGLKWHKGKMYVYGASEFYKGIATYDPATKTWESVKGTYGGKPVIGNAVTQGNPAVNDVVWDSKTGDMYMVGSTGLRYPTGTAGGTVPSAVIRVDAKGEYHAMGHMLLAQMPSKPIKGIYSVLLDETKTPVDIYIGGTFGFRAADSNHKNLVYNVAKWDYATKDWGAIGKGAEWRFSPLDKSYWPDGYPGLPAQPIYGFPTFLTELFPRVRCLAMDKQGNLYAGGSLGILDDNTDVTKRVEAYGIVKYDKAKNEWIPATKSGGVSRDVFQMTWLDDTRLLMTGGFLYSEDYSLLNNVAILDTVSGALSALGGGLHKDNMAHVYACNVAHTIHDDGYWFGGLFKYAGAEKNASFDAPIESYFVAHYNPKENLDPNAGLEIVPNAGLDGVAGNSSKSMSITLEAKGIAPAQGEVIWYQQGATSVRQVGKGLTYKANIRVSKGMKSAKYYVAVQRKDGPLGGKIPVIVTIRPPK